MVFWPCADDDGEMYSYVEAAAAIVTVMDLMVLHSRSAEIELNLCCIVPLLCVSLPLPALTFAIRSFPTSLVQKMRSELLRYKYTDLRFQVVHPTGGFTLTQSPHWRRVRSS